MEHIYTIFDIIPYPIDKYGPLNKSYHTPLKFKSKPIRDIYQQETERIFSINTKSYEKNL
ncbi:MAG: hypothetical protein R6T91_01915 [Bacteroidales bacterium]